MPTHMSELLTAAAARTVPVVQGIRDDQLGQPTPCADFTVRDLINHLYQVVVNFQQLAVREPADFSTTPDQVHGDWRDRFAAETGHLAEAWADPAAMEGESPGMGMPQPVVANMVLLDLVVHGWDLARATGQPYTPDPSAVTLLLPSTEQLAPTGRKMGVFDDAAEIGPEATPFERLLALTGRRQNNAED